MKAASTFFLAAALVGGVSCRRVLQDIPEVGLGPTRPATSSTSQGEDEPATPTEEEELVDAIEADDQVTVVSEITFGELLCDTLDNAEDADALSFLLINDERVIAEKTSFTVTNGDAFTDDVGRRVWTGEVTDPAKAEDEAVPRTVSMTWGDVCDTETFLLKVTRRTLDDTTTIVKTVPCFGSNSSTCLVEVEVEFQESEEALIPDDDDIFQTSSSTTSQSSSPRGSSTEDPGATTTAGSSERRLQLQTETVIDVMVLYSASALTVLGGISSQQMESNILESLVGTNQALNNSEISAYFNPVHIGPSPYEVTTSDSGTTLSDLRNNTDVGILRDSVGADLVQLISDIDNSCGRAYIFNTLEDFGYSIVHATCLDDFSHTHEFGHNLGCHHHRDDTVVNSSYAHAFRYCDGEDPYRTVMSWRCGPPRVNYFSNPGVDLYNKPTGTRTEDNARAFEDNMVAVSNFRNPSPPPTPAPTSMPSTTAPRTTAPSTPAPTTTPPTSNVPPTTALPPTGYTFVACYEDNSRDRVLSGRSVKGDRDMTTEVCADFCEGSPYFGTEFSTECFCGVDSDDPSRLGGSRCTFDCAGDSTQTCGGRDAISVYEYETVEQPSSEFLGCWRDSKSARIMDLAETDARNMTNELCEQICSSYVFYGTQYGRECWCGDESTDYMVHGESNSCNRDCTGDTDTACGGFNAMSVWRFTS